MRNKFAVLLLFWLSLCFAQETPPKLAVYVFGASEASVNKSLSNKLLFTMSQSGKYAEIADPGLFQDEIAKSGKNDIVYIAQTAKRQSADYVCVVNMIETFGAYSFSARIVRTSDLQVLKTGTLDHILKSLEDLTAVSNELTQQLLAPKNAVAPAKQCAKKYNINELVFKIKEGFPNKVKDCSSELAKDTVAASVVMQCTVDGIKKEFPEGFPNTDKIASSLENFVQGFLHSALAGGELDSTKLATAAANTNMGEFLSYVKKLAADECVVDKPYPNVVADKASSSDNKENKKENRSTSFGIRTGINYSHTYAKVSGDKSKKGFYGGIAGFQAGLVADFTANSWFHIQPGLMYIQKGMNDNNGDVVTVTTITAHYLELPLLLSAKLAAFRFNIGPYFSLCLSSSKDVFEDFSFDIGLSTGMGFDIRKIFYIGAFYDWGFADMSNRRNYKFYNHTIGFNWGINL